jgi:hypothetical protein
MQAEWVSLAPMGEKKNGKFVGIVDIKTWDGEFKRGFAFGQNGQVASVSLTSSTFRKASTARDMACFSIAKWGGISVGNLPFLWRVVGYDTYCFNDDSYNEKIYDIGPGGGGGPSPEDYTEILDCAGVPGGTAKFSEECKKCIGGTTGIEKCSTDSLKKIMKENNCLDNDQFTILNNTFNSYLDGQGDVTWRCLTKYIYEKVEASGKKIGFCIDPSAEGNGTYNPKTGNIAWKDPAGLISTTFLGHEFFHAYQDVHYPGGTNQYGNIGYPNIEFEQALFNDIMNGDPTAMGSTAPQSVLDEYEKWVKTITNKYTTTPKQFADFQGQYNHFLTQFYQNANGYAGKGQINPNLIPTALLSVFSTSNCK